MRFLLIVSILLFISCKEKEVWLPLEVTASAYNSTKAQTDGNPFIAAWGDTLKPKVKSVAVSRDLMKTILPYQTKIKIEGLEGIYMVNDKMHHKWKNRIDIYFGEDIKAARNWGIKKVKIYYLVEEKKENR